MKSNSWNEQILAEHRAYLRDDAAIEAFDVLVANAIKLPQFETAPGWHGAIRDFAYNDVASGDRPYAFIVNRHDLLFYVRLAGLKRVPGGFAGLKSRFGTAKENPLGEWTVRVKSREDAGKLNRLLFSDQPDLRIQGSVSRPVPEETPAVGGVILATVPNALARMAVLQQLIDSSEAAERIAPSAWGVTPFSDGFRLNVGQVEVLVLSGGAIRLNLVGQIGESPFIGPLFVVAQYQSVREISCAFVGTPEEFVLYRDSLKESHLRFVERAATTRSGETRTGTRYRDSHSEALIAFAYAEVGRVQAAKSNGGIPDGITRKDVLGAIERLDAGVEHGFRLSLKYDLVFEGRRYPPKAVVGLAAERLSGHILGPGDFSGGESSKSTRILRDLGFDVQIKNTTGSPDSGQSISLGARTARSFTQYWKNSTLDWQSDRALEHAASNQFRARGVQPGDSIFIVSVFDNIVHLGGVLHVDEIVGIREARKRFGKNVWEASDHVIAREPQPFYRNLCLPMSTVKALRFDGGKGLVFKETEILDPQTLRGVRELTAESALLLEALLTNSQRSDSSLQMAFPNELEPGQKYVEGARKQVWVNAYERDAKGREACLGRYGLSCAVCDFNFEVRYGELGKGFIHVHHLKPLALTDGEYELNPITDLRPVCPNCHAMLHRGEVLLTIDELREILNVGTA
jgi:HNH endonuclease